VRRNGETIWDVDKVREAFSSGLSIDRLHLRAGDEIWVPQLRRGPQLGTVVTLLSATAAVAAAVLQVRQR
jgi:hypothetical protein